MGKLKAMYIKENPPLYEWLPNPGEIFYVFDGENVKAEYNGKVGDLSKISTLPIFYIKKSHYKARMTEIVHHMNYFTRFYDLDKDTFFSMMLAKYYCDTHVDIPQREFINYYLKTVITQKFISKCKMMARNLYKLNIDADTSGKFNNTPKISNAQARQIVAVSFAFKIITPSLLHFANVNTNFNPKEKTEYTKWFYKIFVKIMKLFEVCDIKFYNDLRNFIAFRGDKISRTNTTAFYQKKMLRGDTLELYNETLINEVVCVKTLYKLDYRQSCVAFFDGIIYNFNTNYLKENFASKPYEIDSEETSKDSDETISNAEVLEMSLYNRDESSAMVSDNNNKYVVDILKKKYSVFHISEEEFNFYYENFYPNEINQFLFKNFFAEDFKDVHAVSSLNKKDTVYLTICMKKDLQRRGLMHLAQMTTAKAYRKYKENIIKNTKFLEEIVSSNIYKEIVSQKYAYIMELGVKENLVLQALVTILNSTFILVDYAPSINGYSLEHLDRATVAHEYLEFLSII